MIDAGALLIALGALWLACVAPSPTVDNLAVAVAAACAVILVSARLGFVGGAGFWRGRLAILGARGFGATFSSAAHMLRTATPLHRLKPALVRVRTRPARPETQAAFANRISVERGALALTSDADGVLVHVLDEDDVDAHALTALEASVIAAVEGRAS